MTEINLPPEKKVGHLTLLREARPISPGEFNALSFEERLAMVRAVNGGEKYRLLLEAKDAEELVRHLPAQEMYLLLKELGKEEIPELLSLVTAEQFTAFLDLDCWDGDLLSAASVRHWLALLLDGGEEEILRVFLQTDFELLVLLLKKFLTVLSGPEDIEDEDVRAEAVQRDGGYQIEFRDSEDAKVIGRALGVLFRHDRDEFGRVLEAVRWESEAQLEEEVYRLRSGRLLDRGFADPFEALGVYSYLDPETFDAATWRKGAVPSGEEGMEAPGFILSIASPRDLLAGVLDRGLRSEAAWELTFLLNKVMAADRLAVGDTEEVRRELEEVYRTLNLALAHLSGGDQARAEEIFNGIYLEALFRIGFSLTLRLRRRAERLRGTRIGPYLDPPFRALIGALCRKKPRLFEGVKEKQRTGEGPFATLEEIGLAEAWLEKIEIQRQLFEECFSFELPAPEAIDLTGCVPGEASALALSDFFLTGLANRLLGRDFSPAPIGRNELGELHRRVCRQGRLHEELREETRRWLEGLTPGGGAFGDACLDLWAEEFCPLDPDRLDPRYLRGLIVRNEAAL
jgi:hypothetical protein